MGSVQLDGKGAPFLNIDSSWEALGHSGGGGEVTAPRFLWDTHKNVTQVFKSQNHWVSWDGRMGLKGEG